LGVVGEIIVLMTQRSAVVAAMLLVAFVSAVPAQSFADERCAQLEALHAQYAGVVLTTYQKQIKAKLVAWYYSHCRFHPVSD
jgi:hypothetical protein